MQRLKHALACALLASLVAFVIFACVLVRKATDVVAGLPSMVERQAREQSEATRQAAVTAIAETRRDLLAEVARTRVDLFARVDRLTDVSERAAQDLTKTADTQLSAINTTVAENLGRANDSIASVASIRASLQPTIDHVNEASGILLRRDAMPAQLLGLTAAAKVTLGQTAETMRDIQRATPRMLTTWDEIGNNVKATTAASTEASRNTAQVMQNFARATKPLPTWARIGLAVAPPLAQLGVSVATTLAVTGKVGK